MADTEQEGVFGLVHASKSGSTTRNVATGGLATAANYADVNALRTRLAAINGSYYTAARLNSMTKNDMVYAVRLNDDATSIK